MRVVEKGLVFSLQKKKKEKERKVIEGEFVVNFILEGEGRGKEHSTV